MPVPFTVFCIAPAVTSWLSHDCTESSRPSLSDMRLTTRFSETETLPLLIGASQALLLLIRQVGSFDGRSR